MTSEPEPEPAAVPVPVVWVGVDDLPTVKINQFVLQVDPAGDVFLTVGTLTPPVLLGDSAEELRKQVEAIGYVPIRGVGKYALSARHLHELIGVLQNGVKMLERPKKGEK